jgi:hypothetical protein
MRQLWSVTEIHLMKATVAQCIPKRHCSQYNETNVMHSSFSLLRIKDLYMFQALLAVKLQPCHSQLPLYACNIPNTVF